jgi:hypothetical protein
MKRYSVKVKVIRHDIFGFDADEDEFADIVQKIIDSYRAGGEELPEDLKKYKITCESKAEYVAKNIVSK